MSQKTTNPDCPCASRNCPRHGDCDACRANHHGKGDKTACEKLKSKG